MTRFRALLVGLGQMGCGYDADLPFAIDQPRSSARTLSHARALACHAGFSLEAGIDPSPGARQRFTKLYRAPAYPDLTSWHDARPRGAYPDLVVVAVPPQFQPALVQKTLQLMKPRMLLLEKPVACDIKQSRDLKAACDAHPQLQVAVNYIRSWLPLVQEWRAKLSTGELGKFLHGQLTYGKGLLVNGSHFVNLAETLLGPFTLGKVIDRGMPCLGFDREASLDLLATNHNAAPLYVRSIGGAGLRAGELDLWFQGGRVCWLNHGNEIAFWPRREPTSDESHASLSTNPELVPTGMDHYQLAVVDALHRHLRHPSSSPLECSLSNGSRTLETLAPAF